MWLKSCPRCHGDLFQEAAIGMHRVANHYVSCLQCGHVLSEVEEQHLYQSTDQQVAITTGVA
jgi:hypothetical protein